MLLILGSIFTFIGVIFKVFPPKKINYIYGYRTRLSMKNQETWEEAQRFSAYSMIILGVISVILGLILNFITNVVSEWHQNGIFFIGVVMMILCDEIHLTNRFKSEKNK